MKNLICTVCSCRLNGIEPLNQHLSSASHIRKVEIKKTALRSLSSKVSNSSSSQVSTSQHESSPTHLSTEETTVNLNPLGLGDGIQIFHFQNASLPSFVRPGEVSDLTQGVNISQKETNLPAAAMNVLSWKPQRGPKGEAYVMTGNKGICYICNVELTSQQHCQQHITGGKHIKKERDITSLLANSPTGNAHLLNSAQITLPQEHNFRVVNNRGPNGSVYDVLGPGGHCFVCNVVFTSTQLANEHITGQKHKKKLASQNLLEFGDHNFSGVASSGQPARLISSSGPSGDVSSGAINSWQTVGQGFNAADHIPSVVTKSEQPSQVGFRQTGNISLDVINSVPTAGNASPVGRDSRQIEEYTQSDGTTQHTTGVTSGMDRPGQTTAPALTNALNSGQIRAPALTNALNSGLTHGYISSNLGCGVLSGNIPPHPATSGQITSYAASGGIGIAPQLVPSRGPNGEDHVMNGNRGYCYICKLVLTSALHAQSHLTGKKHKKKNWEEIVNGSAVNTSAEGILSSDNSRVLMCSICNVPFSSTENARQHFVSDKHKKRLAYVTSNFPGENVQDTNHEQAGAMPVYQSTAQMPAHGAPHLHGHIRDFDTPVGNAQGQSEQLFALNREFWKGPNTETFVMNDDRGASFDYNIQPTSPQHFRQHIQESKHIIREKESLSLKSLETVDAEQTKVMKLYDSTDQMTPARGNSRGLIADVANTIENELQIKSEHLLPPNRGLPTGANTEAYVMSDNRDTCTELTSPQNIQVNKNINKVNELFSEKSHEAVDPKQSQIVVVNQSQVQNVSTHRILESDPLKALGSFNNSIGNFTLINQRYNAPPLPSVAHIVGVNQSQVQNVSAHSILDSDSLKTLGSFNNSIGNSVLIDQPYNAPSLPSLAYSNITEEDYSLSANTVSSETNASDSVSSKTGSDVVIKLETYEQSSSETSDTQTKFMLQNDNLSNQQEESMKVENKEIVHSNDYAERDNLSSQQKAPLKVENKEIVHSNDYAENDNLGSQQKEPLKVGNKEIVHSNDYVEHDNLSSQQKALLKVMDKEIVHSNDYAENDNLRSQQKEPMKVGNKEIVHSNDYAEHDSASYSITENNQQPSEMPASEDSKYQLYPLTQPGEIQQTSHHNAASSSSYADSTPDSRSLVGVTSRIQKLSLSNDKWADKSVYPLTQPDKIPQSSQQNSDSFSSSLDLQQASNKGLSNVVPSQTQLLPLNGSLASSMANKSAPYYFNGSNGCCFCCSVELTSLKHANQHLNGQKHKKRLGQWELTSAFQNGLTSTFQNGLTSTFQNGLTSTFQNGLTSTFQNGLSQQTQLPSELQVQQQHAEDNSYQFNGDRGFCYVCNIELTSNQHKQQHTHGKPHKRAKERFSMSQNGVAYPLNCQICSKIFTGQESAQQHFTSAKHKSRADVSNESGVVLSVVDEGRVIMKDGQLWHVCDVCKVAMNTREQFLFHRESPKHKKECENPSRISFSETQEVSNHVITPEPSNGSMRTSSRSSSSRASSVETVQDELDNAAIRSLQAKFEDLQIQEETNRQRVLDENRHYLMYGQTPVISRDIGKVASSGQLVVSQDTPVVAGARQSLFSQDIPTDAGSGQPLFSRDIPTVAGARRSLFSPDIPTVASSGQPLSSQGVPITTGSVTTALVNSDVASIVFKGPIVSSGYPVTGTMSNSAAATYQSSVRQNDTNARIPAQMTDDRLSDYNLSEHSRPLSAQANCDSSQMYADFWRTLGADGGQNAGLDSKASSHTRGGATLSHSSGGNNAASTHVSDSLSRSINQGVMDSSGEDMNIGEDDQNHLNSLPGDYSFSNSDNLGNVIMNPRQSKQSRSRGNERIRNGVLSLGKKDDDEFNDDYEEEGRDDLNIVEVPPEVPVPIKTPAVPVRSGKPGFRYYCPICNRHMNTRETYETHIKGKYHVYMLSSQPAPDRNFEPICKTCTNEDLVLRMCGVISKELKITPRVYQIELVLKAMKGDCIIYLPTGTGKTLVAVLTMGLMLQDNPSRPVLFLVDKVLLVMQQAQYIIRHFAGTLFERQDGNPGSPLVTRVLQVKPICGGLTTKTDLPVWKHDIVVTTAAYCANMLDRGQIKWGDFSLVVLDEVHHCGKGHPYHRLMSTYHCSLPEPARAKVLGLTASPAGKSTVEQTYIMLKSLLKNLGGATVAVVEENNDCLDHYQSMAKVKPICVPMSSKEVDFKGHLLEYFILCYSQLALMTNDLKSNEPPCSFFLDALDKPGNREVAFQLAEKFIRDPEPLSEVLDVIHRARCIDEADVAGRNRFDNLRLHICNLLLIIPEVGSGADIEELLATLAPSGITEEFKKMALPCDQIYQRAKHFASDGNSDLTMFSKLVETLQDPDVINWTDTSSRALVLVRERKRARQYCLKLRAHAMVESKQLRVGHIVGHGKGAKDGGMDVKKQRKVFDNHEKYHILVATSIMEEGIDIQALQLVVCMNPPNSLRALVQMRGRARRGGSHFVVLCSSQEDVDKLNSLQKQEQNMQEAAKRCLEESKLEPSP